MKQLFSLIVFLAATTLAFAQPKDSTGEQKVKEQMTLLNQYIAYNSEIDASIAKNQYLQHRLNLNANSDNVPGVGAYNKTAIVYFEAQGQTYLLKKIIILTIKGSNQAYTEFLFDPNQKLYRLTHTPNMGSSDASANKAFYYDNEQMVLYTKEGIVYDTKEYDQNAFQESVDWLNKAEEYRLIFQSISRVLPAE